MEKGREGGDLEMEEGEEGKETGKKVRREGEKGDMGKEGKDMIERERKKKRGWKKMKEKGLNFTGTLQFATCNNFTG